MIEIIKSWSADDIAAHAGILVLVVVVYFMFKLKAGVKKGKYPDPFGLMIINLILVLLGILCGVAALGWVANYL